MWSTRSTHPSPEVFLRSMRKWGGCFAEVFFIKCPHHTWFSGENGSNLGNREKDFWEEFLSLRLVLSLGTGTKGRPVSWVWIFSLRKKVKKSFKVLSTGLQYLVCGCTMITFLFVPKAWKRVLFISQKSSDFPGGRLGLPACQRRKIHGTNSFSPETYLQFWNVTRSELSDVFFKQRPHHHQTFKTSQWQWRRWRQGRMFVRNCRRQWWQELRR